VHVATTTAFITVRHHIVCCLMALNDAQRWHVSSATIQLMSLLLSRLIIEQSARNTVCKTRFNPASKAKRLLLHLGPGSPHTLIPSRNSHSHFMQVQMQSDARASSKSQSQSQWSTC
jgi:hypothetical protein